MLLVKIVNDGTGTDIKADYNYEVYVNKEKISWGMVKNYDRRKGWRGLVKTISEQGNDEQDRRMKL